MTVGLAVEFIDEPQLGGWFAGLLIGSLIVLIVVVIVAAILAYASRIAKQSREAAEALEAAYRSTLGLWRIRETIDATVALSEGARRVREERET